MHNVPRDGDIWESSRISDEEGEGSLTLRFFGSESEEEEEVLYLLALFLLTLDLVFDNLFSTIFKARLLILFLSILIRAFFSLVSESLIADIYLLSIHGVGC